MSDFCFSQFIKITGETAETKKSYYYAKSPRLPPWQIRLIYMMKNATIMVNTEGTFVID